MSVLLRKYIEYSVINNCILYRQWDVMTILSYCHCHVFSFCYLYQFDDKNDDVCNNIFFLSCFLFVYRGGIIRYFWCDVMSVFLWNISLFCLHTLLAFLLFVLLSVENESNDRKQFFTLNELVNVHCKC